MPLVSYGEAMKMDCVGPEPCGERRDPFRRTCVGPRCMAWRWGGTFHEAGYCGLVSKPEPDPMATKG